MMLLFTRSHILLQCALCTVILLPCIVPLSIAPRTAFCCTQLVHSRHSLFELVVLALLVAMSLRLSNVKVSADLMA
jgi:hypothetical protein